MKAGKNKDRKKESSGVGLFWIVHLVCCGLLLVFLIGGISIGVLTSYLIESLVPVGIAVGVIITGWSAYHLWRKHHLNRNLRSGE